MEFESNIAGVIRQVERLRDHIPVAMDKALKPKHWHAAARDLAQRTLLAIAKPVERRFISGFVEDVTATVLQAGGLGLQLRSPFPALRNLLGDAQSARAALDPVNPYDLFRGQVSEVEDLILQWVETPVEEGGKHRDSRDWGKSDEQIANLISYIMLSPNVGVKGSVARQKLAPHIAAYLQKSQADRLSAPAVDRWLRAVLAAWRELVRTQYPARVREELLALKGDLL